MEPNPYEAPKTEQPLERAGIIKRSIGLAVVLLLTPPAFGIAISTYCTAVRAAARQRSDAGYLILLPPIVLLGMLWLSAYVRGKRQNDADRKRFINEIIGIPLFMLLSFAASYVLAALAYFAVTTRAGQIPGGGVVIMAAFLLPPFAVLCFFLQRAWRYR